MSQNGHVSRSLCRALDDSNALTWNGAGWSATAISCPDSTTASAGDCTTAGPFADPRAGVLDSVSCPTASFCAAVDGTGNALTAAPVPGRPGRGYLSWSRPATIDPIAGILTSVSCPTASFCAAVDGTGYTFTWNGTSWSRPVWSATSPADPDGGALTSVSCPTARFCVAVDGDGRALTWNGHAWSAPQLIDPDGGGLTAISCPTAWSCTATDFTGRIVTLH
jgi:hypothetical protein